MNSTTSCRFSDIAAQAHNFQIVVGERGGGVDGTGCALPVRSFLLFLHSYQYTRCGRRRLWSLRSDFPIVRSKVLLGFLGLLLYSIGATGVIATTPRTHLGCGTSFSTIREWD
ncbi:hypothetical protein BC834DRAFT_669862 [Gloeopeniophorella convolvens]|nr:hypothetical protein BC834DRAFT_669862 [Gloeopeniophorella convolvens]